MTSALVVPTWAAAMLVLVIAVLVALTGWLAIELRRTRQQRERVLAAAAADVDALREELDALEVRLRQEAEQPADAGRAPRPAELTVVDDRQYVITEVGQRKPAGPLAAVPIVPAPLFVDIVLRESLIRTASLAAGLRRALAPEVRNRVRFEMRREVNRARRQRRAEARQARRRREARQRAGAPVSDVAG